MDDVIEVGLVVFCLAVLEVVPFVLFILYFLISATCVVLLLLVLLMEELKFLTSFESAAGVVVRFVGVENERVPS